MIMSLAGSESTVIEEAMAEMTQEFKGLMGGLRLPVYKSKPTVGARQSRK